jgi:hypothetical protein
MGISEILASIDHEIAQLKQARALLGQTAAKNVDRPRSTTSVAVKQVKKKRNLTPDGRRRIAEAVKRRWAAQKAAAK